MARSKIKRAYNKHKESTRKILNKAVDVIEETSESSDDSDDSLDDLKIENENSNKQLLDFDISNL